MWPDSGWVIVMDRCRGLNELRPLHRSPALGIKWASAQIQFEFISKRNEMFLSPPKIIMSSHQNNFIFAICGTDTQLINQVQSVLAYSMVEHKYNVSFLGTQISEVAREIDSCPFICNPSISTFYLYMPVT